MMNRSFRLIATSRCFSSGGLHKTDKEVIGFIGLGHMGSKMVENMARDGKSLLIYDRDSNAAQKIATNKIISGDVASIATKCSVIFTMLPNDKAVEEVSTALIHANKNSNSSNKFIHVSCSTISPGTSRRLVSVHSDAGHTLITAPVFARPDGIAKRQATWMLGGKESARMIASELLTTAGNIVDMGEDVGASNVVKLCGNFLIASSIESIAEAMALAEKHGVDRKKVMNILSSSIFDCLIYRGYGQRVSERDHRPGGFSLALGLKDVTLVSQAAREADVPMPFLSTLLDRYVSAKAKGRADFDWSAIGLSVSEDAGIDVSKDVARTRKDVDEGNFESGGKSDEDVS